MKKVLGIVILAVCLTGSLLGMFFVGRASVPDSPSYNQGGKEHQQGHEITGDITLELPISGYGNSSCGGSTVMIVYIKIDKGELVGYSTQIVDRLWVSGHGGG